MAQIDSFEPKFVGVSSLLYGAVFLYISYFIGDAIYSIYFSPLAKFTGPKLEAASSLPYWFYTLSGRKASWTQRLHDAYGPVVRVAPTQLSYIDAAAWKDIYGHRTGRGAQSNEKDPAFYIKQVNGADSLVTEPSDAEHGRVRKIFANAFSHKALVEQEPLIRKYTDMLVDKSTQIVGKAVDIVKLYNFATFDIMGDLTFGEPLHLLENTEYSPWVAAVFGGFKAGDMSRIVLEYPSLAPLFRLLVPKRLQAMRKSHFQNSVDRVERRLAVGANGKPDIWALVMRDNDPTNVKLDAPRMHANASLFMLAGTETTATLLSGLTYHLLRNPPTMAKLVGEIRNAFASDDEMNLVNLQQLPYLGACIDEGLRMYPPVPTGTPRRTPKGGASICGEWVPGGTRVYLSHYPAYHSAYNFREPDKFLPERWLDAPGFENDKRDVVQPFSFGPRNCLGKNLAYHEIRLILSKMLWKFDMELCPESEAWCDQYSWTLWEKPPLMVKLALA